MVKMNNTISTAQIYFFVIFGLVRGTIDINFPEYQYLADHLTEGECHKLVTALHFKQFGLPNEWDVADVSCVDLLLHWNSSPREGKGETHIHVCHRLNQIGRQDLARWLTQTVFHQLSKELRNSMTSPWAAESNGGHTMVTFNADEEIFIDEAAWSKLDTFLSVVLVVGLATLVCGAVFFCYLCAARKCSSCNTSCAFAVKK